ncbi:unnamed protein product, partial [Ascophyllum nodosum]
MHISREHRCSSSWFAYLYEISSANMANDRRKDARGDSEDPCSMMLQILSQRAEAVERRLRGEEPDLSDPIERVKEHCIRLRAASVRYK